MPKIQIVSIIACIYFFLFFMSIITSSTEAYFTDSQTWSSEIKVGTWWDKSDLNFTSNNPQNITSCTQVDITAEIENRGFTMIGTTEYEVYYSEALHLNETGEKIYEGIIDPIGANSTLHLAYQADKPGYYAFKFFQRPGYNQNYDLRSEVWSGEIMVTCIKEEEPQQEVNDESSNIEITEEKEQVEENAEITSEIDVSNPEEDDRKENNDYE
ncbi:amyloid fiber anchoring/assembly protein TapA [Fredinandcohnia sp. 179-A 10B2 NHS]|uniref:amyloid fiber anchoring/assembly protein TapA n=1 Tax=Fredinandcohnia sp. 179-A 10B2 NHS TaxID=3235176 RepID=UPI0039A14EF3